MLKARVKAKSYRLWAMGKRLGLGLRTIGGLWAKG